MKKSSVRPSSMDSSSKPTAEWRAAHRRSQKALGQNFLIDKSFLEPIMSAADVGPEDTILEIGPGLGALTKKLVGHSKLVVAVELDSHLAATLANRIGRPQNLHIINADARFVNLDEILDSIGAYKIVANLPYYAANPILRRFIETESKKPTIIVVMTQKEVAESMVAKPGGMGLLSVATQVYGCPSVICAVPPEAFVPLPKVHSAVVRIMVRDKPMIPKEDVEGFFDLVKAGFAAPRKQLGNSLALGLGIKSKHAQTILGKVSMDPTLRPQDLSVEDWKSLYRLIGPTRGLDVDI